MSYLQNNALGLLLPEDQSQASTYGSLGLSSMYGNQAMLNPGHLGDSIKAYESKMDGINVGQIGQGQSQNPYGNGISMQQSAESNPFGYGSQEYDPGNYGNSLYQTGKIIG